MFERSEFGMVTLWFIWSVVQPSYISLKGKVVRVINAPESSLNSTFVLYKSPYF